MRRLVLTLLLPLMLLSAAAALIRYFWTIAVAPSKTWRIAIGFDQLANVAFNGSEDETVSSRAARAKREGRRWGCVLCRFLNIFETDHCEKSVGV